MPYYYDTEIKPPTMLVWSRLLELQLHTCWLSSICADSLSVKFIFKNEMFIYLYFSKVGWFWRLPEHVLRLLSPIRYQTHITLLSTNNTSRNYSEGYCNEFDKLGGGSRFLIGYIGFISNLAILRLLLFKFPCGVQRWFISDISVYLLYITIKVSVSTVMLKFGFIEFL